MKEDFQFQGKGKRSYESSSRIMFSVGVFLVTSLIAYGVWALINFITTQI